MKCARARILISAAQDGELSPKEQAVLDRHVSQCAECAREKAAVAELHGSMAMWTDAEPSEWLAQSFSYKLGQLMDEKRTAQAAPRRRFGIFAPVAGFAAVALLIVMLLHNRAPIPTTPPKQSRVVATGHGQTEIPAVDTAGMTAKPPANQGNKRIHGENNTVRHRTRWHPNPTHVAVAPQPHPAPRPAPEPGTASSGAGVIADEAAVSGVAPSAAADEIKYNIGEAGIAMNESMERLRGTLQEACDLVVAKPPVPMRDDQPAGGNVP